MVQIASSAYGGLWLKPATRRCATYYNHHLTIKLLVFQPACQGEYILISVRCSCWSYSSKHDKHGEKLSVEIANREHPCERSGS